MTTASDNRRPLSCIRRDIMLLECHEDSWGKAAHVQMERLKKELAGYTPEEQAAHDQARAVQRREVAQMRGQR